MFVGICYHDAGWDLLKNLIDSLERCECTTNHYIFVNTHNEPLNYEKYILEKLPSSEFHSIDVEQRDRIPVNNAWKYLALLAKERREDWFFADNDVVFFAKNAINVLYDEFLQKNCRMCGTLMHDPQGVFDLLPPGLRERAGGLHSVGVAFYDALIIDIAHGVYGCPDNIPYDVWCKDQLLSNFSASCYGVHRLKRELTDLDFLLPNQFFHHGCKDSTLWDLVLKNDHWAELPEILVPEVTI